MPTPVRVGGTTHTRGPRFVRPFTRAFGLAETHLLLPAVERFALVVGDAVRWFEPVQVPREAALRQALPIGHAELQAGDGDEVHVPGRIVVQPPHHNIGFALDHE